MLPQKSRHFLPSLSQVQTAAGLLPDPESYVGDTCDRSVEEWQDKYSISFRRVRFVSRNGRKTWRWVYEGKIMVRPGSSD